MNIPPEIVIRILDQVGPDDATLAASCLVSTAFLPLARERLYNRIITDELNSCSKTSKAEFEREQATLLHPHLAAFPQSLLMSATLGTLSARDDAGGAFRAARLIALHLMTYPNVVFLNLTLCGQIQPSPALAPQPLLLPTTPPEVFDVLRQRGKHLRCVGIQGPALVQLDALLELVRHLPALRYFGLRESTVLWNVGPESAAVLRLQSLYLDISEPARVLALLGAGSRSSLAALTLSLRAQESPANLSKFANLTQLRVVLYAQDFTHLPYLLSNLDATLSSAPHLSVLTISNQRQSSTLAPPPGHVFPPELFKFLALLPRLPRTLDLLVFDDIGVSFETLERFLVRSQPSVAWRRIVLNGSVSEVGGRSNDELKAFGVSRGMIIEFGELATLE